MADIVLLFEGIPIEVLDRGDGTYRFAVELEAGAAAIGSVTVSNAAGSGVYVRPGTAATWTITAANLDIAISALRDAIAGSGAGAKTLANLATLLNGGLPAALAAGGGLKVEGVAGGVAQPVSGTVTANQGTAAAALSGWPAKDDGPAWSSAWGVSGAPVTSADMSGAAVAVTDVPTGGQKVIIDDILVSSNTALRFVFTEETSGAVLAHARVAANGTAQITFRGKRKLATADKRVFCQASAAGNVEVLVGYHSEA